MKVYKWECPIRVQANDIDEAKERLENRLKTVLNHPDRIEKQDIRIEKYQST